MRCPLLHLLLACLLSLAFAPAAVAQECPAVVPAQGAPILSPLPLFPADNWWNADVRPAPVDANSANFIAFINNGGNRKLHPDFGGEESPGSTAVYGFPYAVIGAGQPRLTVIFDYDDQSDGNGLPYYPIPAQAITQTHWIEGGAPGNVDQRDENDRHLLIIDCASRALYELYNVWYSTSQQQWYAGSGAAYDLMRSDRRPDGWTSADAAGLAIFPGLVRYDEAANAAVPEIQHALRVTMRASNGYVYPASHRAGSTPGALPMGARLRLKSLVNGVDPATRTSDPVSRKIFRAMQKYGLIMADNGSDMYVSGTFDLRWNNDTLNPAFSSLSASDFEVVQLGWKHPDPVVRLDSVSVSPSQVYGGATSTGRVALSSAAPAGGIKVILSSASTAFLVPPSITVPQGSAGANFTVKTAISSITATGTLSATYAGVTKTTPFTVTPSPPLMTISDALVVEGNETGRSMIFTIRLSRPATDVVSYRVATADNTATAGSDYTAWDEGGVVSVGDTFSTFSISTKGDTVKESNERFFVNLSNVTGAVVTDSQGVGLIIDDEGRLKMPSPITGMTKPVVRARRGAPARVPSTRRVGVRTQVILRRLGLTPRLEP